MLVSIIKKIMSSIAAIAINTIKTITMLIISFFKMIR